MIVKVVPKNRGYMLLGNLFTLDKDYYALCDEFGMLNCIGKQTGVLLGIEP